MALRAVHRDDDEFGERAGHGDDTESYDHFLGVGLRVHAVHVVEEGRAGHRDQHLQGHRAGAGDLRGRQDQHGEHAPAAEPPADHGGGPGADRGDPQGAELEDRHGVRRLLPATPTSSRSRRRSTPRAREMRRVEHVMGFPVSLRVDDEGDGDFSEETADALFAWLREVDARFSPFRADSEVCRHDRGELQLGDLSADLTEVLAIQPCSESVSSSGSIMAGWNIRSFATVF